MFGKKCSKCNSRIKSNYKFCHSCGIDLKDDYDKEDYGMLGKNDFDESMNFTDKFMEKMFNSAMKIIEKQMRSLDNEIKNDRTKRVQNNPSLNVQFFVNGEKIFNDNDLSSRAVKINNNFSKEKLKRFADLPKEEPKSNIRRFADRVIYELVVPGVNSIEDVLVVKLENSLEIKALSKDRVYSKNINLNLPIVKYQLIDGNLVIEMQTK
ncbi:MAG: zinc ribbon domain-containing protein [Nanoarchaeota archaeon]